MYTTEDFQKAMEEASARADAFEKEHGNFGPAAWESEPESDAVEKVESSDETQDPTSNALEESEQPEHEVEEDGDAQEEVDDTESDPGGEEEDGDEAEGASDEAASEPSVSSEPEDVQRAIKILKKRGFNVDDKALVAPTIPERKAFREKMRKQRADFAQREDDFNRQAEETLAGIESKASELNSFKEAVKSRDFNEIAKVIGYESWRDLNVDFARGESDPARIQMLEMRKELNERKKADEKRADAERQKQAQEAEVQRIRDYSDQLKNELLPEVEDEQIKKFANDPAFRDTVIQHQKQFWDKDTQTTISVEEAARMALKNARGVWENLNSVFGTSGASKDQSKSDSETEVAGEPNSRATAKRKAKKATKTISQRRSKEASRKAPEEEMSDAEWASKWGKKMKEADIR